MIIAGALLLRLCGRNFRPLRGDIRNMQQRADQSVAFPDSAREGGDAARLATRTFLASSVPNLRDSAVVRRILAECDPSAGSLFEEGIRLLDEGDPDAARNKFEHLIEAYPGDKTKPLASWAIGLSYYLAYYRGGGAHNLHQAANQFIRFRDGYESDKDLEELVQAAMFDIPVLSIELMRSAPSEYERTHAAALAQSTLSAFLARWPDDPRAAAARAELAEIQSFIDNTR